MGVAGCSNATPGWRAPASSTGRGAGARCCTSPPTGPGTSRTWRDTIGALVAAGADVDAPFNGPHAETPLHWAASSDDVAALDALLDAGADIEARRRVIGGGTPLADAAAFGAVGAARRLVERGAARQPLAGRGARDDGPRRGRARRRSAAGAGRDRRRSGRPATAASADGRVLLDARRRPRLGRLGRPDAARHRRAQGAASWRRGCAGAEPARPPSFRRRRVPRPPRQRPRIGGDGRPTDVGVVSDSELIQRTAGGEQAGVRAALPSPLAPRLRPRAAAARRLGAGGGCGAGHVRVGLALGAHLPAQRGVGSAWLYTVARNTIVDCGRASARAVRSRADPSCPPTSPARTRAPRRPGTSGGSTRRSSSCPNGSAP